MQALTRLLGWAGDAGVAADATGTNADLPVVAVLGGGYGGVAAAQELARSGMFRVLLIDRKEYFLNNIAGVPAAVHPGYADGTCIRYDSVFDGCGSLGQFVQAEVAEVTREAEVILQRAADANGGDDDAPLSLRPKYVVVATGSSYAFPFKIPEADWSAAVDRFARVPPAISAVAQEKGAVVVCGGGAVGCEIAGEIGSAHPDATVVLVHSRDKLLPGDVSDELRERTLGELRDNLGVRVVLGERVIDGVGDQQSSNQSFLEGRRTLRTDKGTEIEADIVFLCWGAAVNDRCLQAHFSEAVQTDHRVLVDPATLCVKGCERVFAIGDVCALEAKMACYAGAQGEHVAKVLVAQEKGNAVPSYAGHPNAAMMVPLGGKRGFIQLPNPRGTVFGSPFAALGKDHLIRSWAKRVGPALQIKCPFAGAAASSDRNEHARQRAELAEALGVSEKSAIEALVEGRLPVPEPQEGDGST
jgi:apoptosis-inducing factor 2